MYQEGATTGAGDPTLLVVAVLAALAIVGSFAVVVTSMILRARAQQRAHEERMTLAEQGLDIPPVLYALERQRPQHLRGLRVVLIVLGVVFVLSGVGAMVALGAQAGLDGALSGTAPVLLGLALLISERIIVRVFGENLTPRAWTPTDPLPPRDAPATRRPPPPQREGPPR